MPTTQTELDAGPPTTDAAPTGADAGPVVTDAAPASADPVAKTTDAAPTGADAGPVIDEAVQAPVASPDNEETDLVEDELLVEEISIDGMCGVY